MFQKECAKSQFTKKRKKIKDFAQGSRKCLAYFFSSLQIFSCCAFLLNNCRKKMGKGQTFSSKVKGGKKEKYSRSSARKLFLSVLYDCLHFFLDLELKRSGEPKRKI